MTIVVPFFSHLVLYVPVPRSRSPLVVVPRVSIRISGSLTRVIRPPSSDTFPIRIPSVPHHPPTALVLIIVPVLIRMVSVHPRFPSTPWFLSFFILSLSSGVSSRDEVTIDCLDSEPHPLSPSGAYTTMSITLLPLIFFTNVPSIHDLCWPR